MTDKTDFFSSCENRETYPQQGVSSMLRQETILQFIDNATINRGKINREPIERLFVDGYCYYFALMLKDAFGGELMWLKYLSHIVWYDPVDNICYDARGVNDAFGEDDLIPISVLSEKHLNTYKHIDETIKMSDEDIHAEQGRINEYELSMGWELSRFLPDGDVEYYPICTTENGSTYSYDVRELTLHLLQPSGLTDFASDNNLAIDELDWITCISAFSSWGI